MSTNQATLPYLMQQTFHFRDCVVQLLFDMAGSVQCVVSGDHCSVAVEASTVTPAILVIATGPSTGINGTGSIPLGPTDLKRGVEGRKSYC